MSVGAVCNRNVVVTTRDTTVAEAARMMRSLHVGDLVIVDDDDERIPVGLVTDRDIVVEVVAAGLDPDDLTVADIMRAEFDAVQGDMDFWDALAHMRVKGIRRLPIVGPVGLLEGILTLDDALELIGEALANMVGLIKRGVDQEKRTRSD